MSSKPWVLWIHASSAKRFEHGVRKNLDLLKVPGRADPAANVFQLLREWLQDSKNGEWLLILDNVDNAQYLLEPPSNFRQEIYAAQHAPYQERILDYLPVTSHGSLLLTSRTREAALKVVTRLSVIAVAPMDMEQALKLLRGKLDREHPARNLDELVHALRFMPLAISQAAAYISNVSPRCSVSQYLMMLGESDRSKLSLLDYNDGDLRRDSEATNSIVSTWYISFERIRALSTSTSDLLSLLSFFDESCIPVSFFRRLAARMLADQERAKREPSYCS